MEKICTICKGEGWVCENHPSYPWNYGDPACCGGAGQPCACNTSSPPWLHGRIPIPEEHLPKHWKKK